MSMTADAFDAAVLKRCFWASATAPFTQVERLAIYDEEIAGTLYPKIIAAHADYYLTKKDISLTASQEFYRMPDKAYGPIKDIVTVDTSGNEFSVGLIDAADLGHGYRDAQSGDIATFNMWFRGDLVGLRPIPTLTQGTLRVRYYRQPGALCLAANARQIAPVSLADGTVAGSTLTALWSGSSILDIISAGNAHQALATDLGITSITGTGIDFSSSLTDTGIESGDWAATQGTTPLVQVPDFMLIAAIRQCAAACLMANGDVRAVPEMKQADDLMDLALSTAIPRIEGEPKVHVTRNSPFRRCAR